MFKEFTSKMFVHLVALLEKFKQVQQINTVILLLTIKEFTCWAMYLWLYLAVNLTVSFKMLKNGQASYFKNLVV